MNKQTKLNTTNKIVLKQEQNFTQANMSFSF